MTEAQPSSEFDKDATHQGIRARFQKTMTLIWIPLPENFFYCLEKKEVAPLGSFAQVRRAFISNLRRAETVAAVPYNMAFSAVTRQRFSQILIAERIRQLSDAQPGSELTPEAEARALGIAHRKMDEERESDAARKPIPRLAESTLSVLESHFREAQFEDAAQDLILQTLASIWGAFELLANDVVEISLNENPNLAGLLVNENPAKRHFPIKAVSIEFLMDHGFNISGSMGDIILGERRLSSLEAIRDVFSTFAPENSAVHKALGSDILWRLWQRRHVVVHRRGLVDRGYLERTGDTEQSVGQRLMVRSDDIEEAFATVRDAGAAILSWNDPSCDKMDH